MAADAKARVRRFDPPHMHAPIAHESNCCPIRLAGEHCALFGEIPLTDERTRLCIILGNTSGLFMQAIWVFKDWIRIGPEPFD
jgi:hypothetical protein